MKTTPLVLVAIALTALACQAPTSVAQAGASTGSIVGKALFQGQSDHSGIIVSAESLDAGGRTVAANLGRAGRSLGQSLAAQTTTSSSGEYSLNHLPVGTYTVYAGNSQSVEKAVSIGVTVVSGRAVVAADLSLTATGSIAGRVIRNGSATGNLGTQVNLAGTSYMASTTDDGTFTMTGIPVGSGYLLLAWAAGYANSSPTTVTVDAWTTTAVGTISLVPPVVVQTTGTVVGSATLSGQASGAFAGVFVFLEGTSSLAMTDANGNFTLAGVAPGTYTLTANKIGYHPASQTIVVTAGTTVSASLLLTPPMVTYDGQGATIAAIPSTQTVIAPAITVGILPILPVKAGYYFAGWTTAPSGGGTTFTATTPVTSSTTVYANWAPSGAIWTTRILPTSQQWSGVTYGNGTFVAVSNGSRVAATSPDGIYWTACTLPSSTSWSGVGFGNGTFVAVTQSTSAAATSPDGVTWTTRTLPYLYGSGSRGVTYGNGTFVTLYWGGSLSLASPDGVTWKIGTLPATAKWTPAAYGNGTFVTVAQGGTMGATSPDGVTWTARTLPASAYWSWVAYGNGTFVAVAAGPPTGPGSTLAATSPDGVTWTVQTLPVADYWSGITYGNGIFVAVAAGQPLGQGTSVAATSPNGTTWTTRAFPVMSQWQFITYGNGTFVTLSTNNSANSNLAATSP